LPWDQALCTIDMVTVLDPGRPEVTAAAATARQILEELGAQPFLDRLDKALARPRDEADRAKAPAKARQRASV